MHTHWIAVLGLAALGACTHETPPAQKVAAQPLVAPIRGASGDSDLRVMLSELASSKACAMIRNGFHGLRAAKHPDLVTGVLWIRECEITNVGTRLKFRISGNGWMWIDETKSEAGGTFAVQQYVRFSIAATIRGELDIAYDRGEHVATLWFTPEKSADVEFKPIGNIAVDSQGVWSSVVGTLGTIFATSPEDTALAEATDRGTGDLNKQFENGLAVTINLCTGLTRVHMGRPRKGEMGVAGVGETRRVPVEVQPGGVILVGPSDADNGMTLRATATQGAAKLTLVCAEHAETIASEFMQGRLTSSVPTLASVDVATTAQLKLKPTKCSVVGVVTPLGDEPAKIAWERPTAEIARSSGGPLIHCKAKAKAKK